MPATYSVSEDKDIEDDAMSKTILEALYSVFDNTTFDSKLKTWRVKELDGRQFAEDDSVLIRPILASIIENERSQGVKAIDSLLADGNADGDSSANSVTEAEIDQLSSLLGLPKQASPSITKQFRAPSGRSNLSEDQILLLFPTRGQIDIFPRAWYCKNCGYYRVASPSRLRTLDCPWCSKTYASCQNSVCARRSKAIKKTSSGNCESCNSSLSPIKLSQLGLLFICPKCASQEEVCPMFIRPNKAPMLFSCREKVDGGNTCGKPLKLRIVRPLGRSYWECTDNPRHRQSVRQYCSRCVDAESQKKMPMKLRAASANNLKALTLPLIRVGNTLDISESILANSVEYKLSEDSSAIERKEDTFKLASSKGIQDIWMIKEIRSYAINYGYTFNSYEDDLLRNFYATSDPYTGKPQYKCYASVSSGKGMYIKLDKKKIMSAIGENASANYTKIASDTMQSLMLRQNDLMNLSSVPLFRLLHSLEHAFTMQCGLISGLGENAFLGKVMIQDCGIIIAEKENVEASGIDYIIQRKLLDWLTAANLRVKACKYDCEHGCLTCLFTRDPLCHPLLPKEGGIRYYVPNSLLSRTFVNNLWR